MTLKHSIKTNNTMVKILKSIGHANCDEIMDVSTDGLILTSYLGTKPETIPEMVEFKTTLWYDDNLLNKFSGDHDRAKRWVSVVVEIAKIRFTHNSLEMKVKLVVDGEIKHAKGRKMTADNKSLNMTRYNIKPSSHHS